MSIPRTGDPYDLINKVLDISDMLSYAKAQGNKIHGLLSEITKRQEAIKKESEELDEQRKRLIPILQQCEGFIIRSQAN